MMRGFRKQLGFLYLTTGSNGAGKTLNVLKWVRERQLKESREVFYNGRFELTADFGWKAFEFKDWQTLPDGAIILLDECHNDLPVRSGSAPPPEPVRMLAEHRRRGFDFYLITQHPQNIDLFVRRLIGSPGWHRHLKRTFGADLVSMLEWSAVNTTCEKTGAGKDAKVSLVPFPKEVYSWYKSASLHTGKVAIPKQVYVLGVLLVLIPAMFYFVFQFMKPKTPAQTSLGRTFASGQVAPGQTGSSDKRVVTAAEYVAAYVPRVEGLPQSAPRYDDLEKVTSAPKPAACIHGTRPGAHVKTCSCWSQQGTPLVIPVPACIQIAAGGFFDDTLALRSDVDRPRLSAVADPVNGSVNAR